MAPLSTNTTNNHDTIALLFHPAGSSNKTDGGRDALAFEQYTGIRTIGVDRPGAGLWIPHGGVQGLENYSHELTSAIEDELEKKNLEKIQRIIMVGRSAGGLAAVVAAGTPTYGNIPVVGAYAGEAVGAYDTTIKTGRKTWGSYKRLEKNMIADEDNYPDLVRPEPTDTRGWQRIYRLASMGPFFYSDQRMNGNFWASAPLQQALGRVSAGVLVALDFAESSMVLPQDEQEREAVVSNISNTLEARGDGSSVDIVPSTTHRSFDRREFFATQAAKRLSAA